MVLGALVLLVVLAVQDGRSGDPTNQSTTTTTASAEPSATAATQPAEAPTPSSPPGTTSIDELLGRLVVADEVPRAGYDRDLFPHWSTLPDGCTVREHVLANENLNEPQSRRPPCSTEDGRWLSAYDGYRTADPGELDIDHVVALSEAWDSGADAWDAARREEFANDLDHPGSLIAVTAATNRSKSDRDPATWQPPNQQAWCRYATDWVAVKVRWDLTADPAEVRALENMMRSSCPDGRPVGSTS